MSKQWRMTPHMGDEFVKFLRRNNLTGGSPNYALARTAFYAGWTSRQPDLEARSGLDEVEEQDPA